MLNFAEEHSVEEGLNHVALWNAAFLQSEDLSTRKLRNYRPLTAR